MNKINHEQLEIVQVSTTNRYFSIIESLLFVSGEPLKLKNIASILEIDEKEALKVLNELIYIYNESDRGIKLIALNEEYQLVTKKQNSSYIQKLLKTNARQALSQAALETLAIVAYKQPITRIEIDEIRGVKSDRALSTLMDKTIIRETGRLEVPGRPILYATTEEFLRYFDLENISEMPSLEELSKTREEEVEEEDYLIK